MYNVKTESIEGYYFLARHPRGTQSVWLDYLKKRILKLRKKDPRNKEGRVEVEVIVEPADKDGQEGRFDHTKFRFFPVASLEHQAQIIQELKHHPMTESLQVQIYEQKFEEDTFEDLINADAREFLQKIFFEQLTENIKLVDEVQKAMELLALVDLKIKYDPIRVITNLSIEMDNQEVAEWLRLMLDYQDMDEVSIGPNEKGLQSLSQALTELAWNTGYPDWVVGQRESMDHKLSDDDHIVKLKAFFNTYRMCVGLEIVSDEEFHPYLEYTLSHRNASLCAYVAFIMAPKPGQMILDLSTNVQDYMMAIFHQYDNLIYFNVVDNQNHYNYAKWNVNQMKRFCKRNTSRFPNRQEFIHLQDWTQIEHQNILLSQVDRVILPIPHTERPYTEDLDELMLYIKMDYDVVLRIANKMPLKSRIMLIFHSIDKDYVYQIMTPDIASLQITYAKAIYDREECLIIMEVEKVAPPAPPSPLLARLKQASLRLEDFLLKHPTPVKIEDEEMLQSLGAMREAQKISRRVPRALHLTPKKSTPAGISPGKKILVKKLAGTPKKVLVKASTSPKKILPQIRLPIREEESQPMEIDEPGPSTQVPATISTPSIVIPPPEPLRMSTRIQAKSPRGHAAEMFSGKKVQALLEPLQGPVLLKTPVKYPVKLKKSPRIQEQQQQKVLEPPGPSRQPQRAAGRFPGPMIIVTPGLRSLPADRTRPEPVLTRNQASRSMENVVKSPGRVTTAVKSPKILAPQAQSTAGPSRTSRIMVDAPPLSTRLQASSGSTVASPGRGRRIAGEQPPRSGGSLSTVASPGRTRATAGLLTVSAGSQKAQKTPKSAVESTSRRGREVAPVPVPIPPPVENSRTPRGQAARSPRSTTQQTRSSKRIAANNKSISKKKR